MKRPRPQAILSAPEFACRSEYEKTLWAVAQFLGITFETQVLWSFTIQGNLVGTVTIDGKKMYLPKLSVWLKLAEVKTMYTYWLSAHLRENMNVVEEADKITIEWILENVDLAVARRIFEKSPPPSSRVRHEFEMPVLGSFRIDPQGEIEILVEIPIEGFKPSEGDWDYALGLYEMGRYIQWQKDGHEPPPLSVVKTDKGNLVTQNRRRWLAAREAGVKTLRCWYSPTHPDHCTSPKWRITDDGEDFYT